MMQLSKLHSAFIFSGRCIYLHWGWLAAACALRTPKKHQPATQPSVARVPKNDSANDGLCPTYGVQDSSPTYLQDTSSQPPIAQEKSGVLYNVVVEKRAGISFYDAEQPWLELDFQQASTQ